jgi:hypothetical protein
LKISIIGKGRGWDDAPTIQECRCIGITQLNLRRSVNLVIDMNVYEDDRWGIREKFEARYSRELAMEAGIPYIDLSNYPIEEIIDYFKTDYFSNTIDYALAYAVYKGYSEIHLYGINMETDTEYVHQKPSVEYWVGRAQGMGVRVFIHGEHSSIMYTKDRLLYGYDRRQKDRELWATL